MKRVVLLLLFFRLLTVPVLAAEDFGAGELGDKLPESARVYMGDAEPQDIMDPSLPRQIAERAQQHLRSAAGEVAGTVLVMMAVVLICGVSEAADSSGRSAGYVLTAGVAAIGAASVADVDSYMAQSVQAMETLADYSRVILPVLSATAAAGGAVTAAAAKSAATAVFMDLLLHLSERLILPSVCAYTALSIANAALGNGALKTAVRLTKSGCTLLLSGLTTVFALWISVVGVVAGGADASAARLTKTVLSASLPVVGRILSDASGALAAAGAAFRGSCGSFGLLAVLCVCLGPMLELGLRYLLYKLCAVVCASLAPGRLAELLDHLGSSFAMLLGMTGAAGVFMYISIYSFMRIAL